MRRLPSEMTQDDFIVQVSPLPDYDYMYTVRGDPSLGENAFARIYINFVNSSDVFAFKEKFDNYVFVDKRGHEYPAVVEFATFQKVPRRQQRKPRTDPKAGTIESDPYYLEFLEALKEQPAQEEKPEFSYQFNTENKEDVSTPLLDFVKQRRLDKQRIREERREERRKREIERKKFRETERKVTPKVATRKSELNVLAEDVADSNVSKTEVPEKSDAQAESTFSKSEPKTFTKSKFKGVPRSEKLEFRSRREDFRNRRYEEPRKEADVKSTPKKPKKYSEKREERKNEAKKAELKKEDEKGSLSKLSFEKQDSPKKTSTEEWSKDNELKNTEPTEEAEQYYKDERSPKKGREDKKSDPRVQRRIKNKDRPTMALYQPGMLSKRKTAPDAIDADDTKADED